MYPCPRCEHPFSAPSKLRKHLDKKIRCDVGDYTCKACKKKFSHRNSKWVHEKSCTGKPKTPEEVQRDLEFAVAALAAVAEQEKVSTIVQQQNIQQQNIQQQINLTVNNNVVVNVGDEDCSHFDTTLPGLESLLGINNGREESLLTFCKAVRCNPEAPHNHNILVLDPQDRKVVHRSNGKWKEGDADQAILRALNCDAVSLTSMLIDADDLYDRPDLYAYKFDFLVHNIQRKCLNGDVEGLRSLLDPLKAMLHEVTKAAYVKKTTANVQAPVPEPAEEAGPSDLEMQLRIAQLEVEKLTLQLQLEHRGK